MFGFFQVFRGLTPLLFLLACRPGAEGEDAGRLEPDAEAQPGKQEAPGLIDLGSSETITLAPGITVQSLALDEAAASGRTIRMKISEGEHLPVEIEGFLRLSPELEILSDPVDDVLLVVETAFEPGHLPGGVEKSAVYGAVLTGGTWREAFSFLVKGKNAVCSVVPVSPSRLALLANPRHFTPESEKADGVLAAAAMTMKARVLARVSPGLEASGSAGSPDEDEEEGGEGADNDAQRIIYYLEGGEEKISLGGDVFSLKRIKKSSELPIPFVVADASGAPLRSVETLRRVLLAWKLMAFFTDEKMAALAEIFQGEKMRVETLIPKECSRGLNECFAVKGLFYAIERLDEGFKAKLGGPAGGDMLDAFSELVWVASELEGLWSDPALKQGVADAGVPFSALGVLAAGGKEKKSPAPPLADDLVEAMGPALDEAGAQLSSRIEGLVEALGAGNAPAAGALFSGEGREAFLQKAARFYGAVRYEAVLSTADVLASAAVKKAPSPDTQTGKHSVSAGNLLVKLSGSDEDGRITAYRYWIDDPKVPGLIKGGNTVKVSLGSLGSGVHMLYAAAVDDDDQQDETPAKFSFYVRRYVEVDVKKVEAQFGGPKIGINSEHRRSAAMFAREVLAAVTECTQDHFRFGIDGKGTLKVGMHFGGKKQASVAGKRSVVASSYKNKALTGCVIKALRSGKLRYNQPYQPSATVNVTFSFNPTVLFFDAKTIGDTPGRDATAALVYTKCTNKAAKKIEAFCTNAASRLPGPWDAVEPGEEGKEGAPAAAGDDEVSGEADESDDEASGDEDEEEDKEEEPAPPPPEEPAVKIPTVEFDPDEIMQECVKYSTKHLVLACAVGASSKRVWCIDSCYKQSVQCEKKCKTQTAMELDVGQCTLDCWTEFMLPCSENCILKDTPFTGKP
jgi:hypothetical protein